MKKLILFFTLLTFNGFLYADEGAWLPLLVERLNHTDMKKMGLNLSPEEIYSINKSSMKDAIISLNKGFATAAIISENGLAITSHRGVFNALQKYATSDKDYYEDGFWAKTATEELRCEGFSASFLVRIENVSEKIIGKLTDAMTEAERKSKVEELSKAITHEATDGNLFEAEVKSFMDGNEYYLFVYDVYTDVRLVGIPPMHIGYYGGDKDNWNWPKYTGDFAFLRVYMSPKSEPAIYNKKNIPIKSKYVLPISLKGYEKGDFVMSLGYAYHNTNRYITSSGIKMIMEQINPSIIKIRNEKLSVIKHFMDTDKDAKIQYASKYKESANYRKFYEGQNEQMKRFNMLESSKKLEMDFTNWLITSPENKGKYGNALTTINNAYEEQQKYNYAKYYFQEAIMQGPEVLTFAIQFENLAKELKTDGKDPAKIDLLVAPLKYNLTKFYKNFNSQVDKELFIAMIKLYYLDVSNGQYPQVLLDFEKKYKGNFAIFADDIYSKTMFANKDKMIEFLATPTYKAIENDPVYKLIRSFTENDERITGLLKNSTMELEKGYRVYLAGLMTYMKDANYYSNTNSTMRLNYGKVNDYANLKDQKFNYFTTVDQLMAKVSPEDHDYEIPERYKTEFKKNDFGRYGQDGQLKVCFISDNDACGGYSGSPVTNKNGQLIGVDCDLNFEATVGEYTFEPNYMRAVNVDIRYILFVVEKCSDAPYLIKEMKIAEK